MPTETSKLKIKKPLGNETVSRTAFNENWDIIDQNAASQAQVDQPFYLKSAVYDSGNNKIDLTFGPGRAAFLGTLVVKTIDSTYIINTPAPNTNYYIYLKNDGTYTYNTTGAEVDGAVQIWKVTTGATIDQIATEDRRGQLPGAAAQAVKDDLDAHKIATDPHPQYATDTDLAAHLAETTQAHGGIVPSSDVVTVATANKILKLNASAKLPASITGDADTVDGAHAGTGANNVLKLDTSGLVPLANIPATLTGKNADQVDGYHAGNASGQVAVSNGTLCTNLNSDKVDSIHFRVNSGALQYSTDGSVWYDVGVIANSIRTADFRQDSASANTWYTVLDITGLGVLTRVSAYYYYGNSDLDIRITIDGVAYTIDLGTTSYTRCIRDSNNYIDLITHVKFDSSLKVEVRHTGNVAVLSATVDYGIV